MWFSRICGQAFSILLNKADAASKKKVYEIINCPLLIWALVKYQSHVLCTFKLNKVIWDKLNITLLEISNHECQYTHKNWTLSYLLQVLLLMH